jgi:hypothetical protein
MSEEKQKVRISLTVTSAMASAIADLAAHYYLDETNYLLRVIAEGLQRDTEKRARANSCNFAQICADSRAMDSENVVLKKEKESSSFSFDSNPEQSRADLCKSAQSRAGRNGTSHAQGNGPHPLIDLLVAEYVPLPLAEQVVLQHEEDVILGALLQYREREEKGLDTSNFWPAVARGTWTVPPHYLKQAANLKKPRRLCCPRCTATYSEGEEHTCPEPAPPPPDWKQRTARLFSAAGTGERRAVGFCQACATAFYTDEGHRCERSGDP